MFLSNKKLLYVAIFLSMHTSSYAWESLRPGIDYETQRYSGSNTYITRIDLTSPRIKVRASKNEAGETNVTTRQFGLSFQRMIVAVNGDWIRLDGRRAGEPLGLAIGEGELWNRHPNTSEQNWSFFGCDVTGRCYAGHKPERTTFDPMIAPWRLYQAVGSNEAVLMKNGMVKDHSGHPVFDTRAPRTALCINEAKTTMWMAVIDGRSSASRGMTWNETAEFMNSLGCYDATMQDGGGSSTMWIKDRGVVNVPSDGSLRTLVNHIGIVYRDADEIHPACQEDGNKRWCDGNFIHTCNGGAFSTGDCTVYGAECEGDGEYAYCVVRSQCPAGLGQSQGCINADNIRQCIDGVVKDRACEAGKVCGGDAPHANCTIPQCQPVGGNGSWCEGNIKKSCSADQYSEEDCQASGQICVNGACQAIPVDPNCLNGAYDVDWCSGNTHLYCRGGTFYQEDCASSGLVCLGQSCGVDPNMGGMEPPAGEPAGMEPPAGEPAGTPAGMEPPAGEPAGMPAGMEPPAGEPAGMPAGEPAGIPAGEPAGIPAGMPAGSQGNRICENVNQASWCVGNFLQFCDVGQFGQINCASSNQICQVDACVSTEEEDNNDVVTNPDPSNSLGLAPTKQFNFKTAGQSSCQQSQISMFWLLAVLFFGGMIRFKKRNHH